MGTAMIVVLVGAGCLAVGVLIGRYYVPDNRMLRRTARHAESYARAINRVLDGEQRAAIDELKHIVDENIDEIEPYFALGALFRGCGEWERAIRIHQALALRESESKHIQLRAWYALGLDFRAAGMPLRATRAMESCVDIDAKHEGALQALTGLYEEQGRYRDAVEALRRLHKARGLDPSTREHHLLVAAAQKAIYAGDRDQAKRFLREARRINDTSVHFLAAAAEFAAARDNPRGAGARLREALREAPDLAGFLVPGLVEAERQVVAAHWDKKGGAGEDALQAQNERAAERAVDALQDVVSEGDPHLQLAIAELRSHYEPLAAIDDYRRIAVQFPRLLPARLAAARLALASGDRDEMRAELKALVDVSGPLAWAAQGVWLCRECGHRQEGFFWRCPSCRSWSTVVLDVGDEAAEEPAPASFQPRETMPRGGVERALLGAAERALPAPALPGGDMDGDTVGAPVGLLPSDTVADAEAAAVSADVADAAAAAADDPADPDGPEPIGDRRPASVLSRVGAWFSGVSGALSSRRSRGAASSNSDPKSEPDSDQDSEPDSEQDSDPKSEQDSDQSDPLADVDPSRTADRRGAGADNRASVRPGDNHPAASPGDQPARRGGRGDSTATKATRGGAFDSKTESAPATAPDVTAGE